MPGDSYDPDLDRFLQKLWYIVNDPNTNGVITWGRYNQSFVIKDPEKFSAELCPAYFRHRCLDFFFRTLQGYGFLRIPSTVGSPEFYHAYFCKYRPYLMGRIQRNVPSAPPRGSHLRSVETPENQHHIARGTRSEPMNPTASGARGSNPNPPRLTSILRRLGCVRKEHEIRKAASDLDQTLETLEEGNRRMDRSPTGLPAHQRNLKSPSHSS